MKRSWRLEDVLLGALNVAEDASPVEAVQAVTREVARSVGATAVSLLVADLSGRALVRLAHLPDAPQAPGGHGSAARPRRDEEESATVLPFDGGPAEETLRTQSVKVVAPGEPPADGQPAGSWTVLAPVTERGEALGLLELVMPTEPEPREVEEIARIAYVLGFVLIATRRHTDLYEWGQRSTPYSLSAEIQRRLLPAAYTCEAGAFTLSAWLEPSASVGGDTFDYSLARDALHLSITDAMGHGVDSALTATLCVGSLRNSRRSGVSLLEQATAANAALVEHAAGGTDEGFVTGLLGRLDLRTGVLALVNAGHVAPYLARAGGVQVLQLAAGLPLGLYADTTYGSTELVLEPDDRLILVTDGVLEGSSTDVDLHAAIMASMSLHPREATRCLADEVLAAAGHALADDATLLVLDWHADHGQGRDTSAGADPARASRSLA